MAAAMVAQLEQENKTLVVEILESKEEVKTFRDQLRKLESEI